MKKTGTLWLIPTPLGDDVPYWLLEQDRQAILHIRHFVVEAEKTARKHLKALGCSVPIRELSLSALNEHTDRRCLPELLQPLLSGHDLGLLSEAGCPAIADPGADLVALAHRHNIRVIPLVGPSSILLALMGSGANGQCFTFHGYLPTDRTERISRLKYLEERSTEFNESQIFIETPYRNQSLLEDALQKLKPATRLCIAVNLTLPDQLIVSKPVSDWSQEYPDLRKKPCVFVLYAHS